MTISVIFKELIALKVDDLVMSRGPGTITPLINPLTRGAGFFESRLTLT